MCNEHPSDETIVFNATTLTNAYAGNASAALEVRSYDKFTILAVYAGGAAETGNTCEIEVSFSADGTNYSQYGYWSAAATSTFTAQTFQAAQDTNVVLNLEGLGRWMKIRVKETGVSSVFGTLSLTLYKNKN
jgi:hypothetical protein